MSSLAVTIAVAVPSDREIEERFYDLLPELRSRAVAIAARAKDKQEAEQELISFAWWNYRQAARKGRWLPASQLAWVGMRRLREGCSLGSRRSKTDVLSPACQRRKRANVFHFSTLADAAVPKGIRVRFHEAITQGMHGPAERAATRIDWCRLRSGLPLQQRRVLDGLTAGRGTNEIAERLKLSAGRISQIKTELARAVVGFFGEALSAAHLDLKPS